MTPKPSPQPQNAARAPNERLLPPPIPEKTLREKREGAGNGDERPHFYTAGELAQILRVTDTTIYRLAKSGRLPYFSIGRAIRFKTSDVEEFLREARGE